MNEINKDRAAAIYAGVRAQAEIANTFRDQLTNELTSKEAALITSAWIRAGGVRDAWAEMREGERAGEVTTE